MSNLTTDPEVTLTMPKLSPQMETTRPGTLQTSPTRPNISKTKSVGQPGPKPTDTYIPSRSKSVPNIDLAKSQQQNKASHNQNTDENQSKFTNTTSKSSKSKSQAKSMKLKLKLLQAKQAEELLQARHKIELVELEVSLHSNIDDETGSSKSPNSQLPGETQSQSQLVNQWIESQPFNNSEHIPIHPPNTQEPNEYEQTPVDSKLQNEPINYQNRPFNMQQPTNQPSPFTHPEQTHYQSRSQPEPVVNRVIQQPMYRNTPQSLDSWIDYLIPGQETILNPSNNKSTNDQLTTALVRLEGERDLPQIDLIYFNGNPTLWPKFIEQFHAQVHSRIGLTDVRRLDLLISHLKGEARSLVQGLSYSARNYATVLIELKSTFGHRVTVARAFLDKVTSGTPVSSHDSIGLRNLYISVRDCITTLDQLNYQSDLNSSEVLIKTIKRLPNDKINSWNEFSKKILRYREPNLKDMLTWLKERIEADMNPYAASHSATNKQFTSKPSHGPFATKTHFQNQSDVKSRTMQPSTGNQSERHRTLNTTTTRSKPSTQNNPCILCKEIHILYRCPLYYNKSPDERKKIVTDNKLCENCLSPGHCLESCLSLVVCREPGCNQKHHTSLHSTQTEPKMVINKLQIQRPSRVCFQLIPIEIYDKDGMVIRTNALLDTASEITLIHRGLVNQLGLKGKNKYLTITTINGTTSQPSALVSLTVKPTEDPSPSIINIKEAWVVPAGSFNCPSQVIDSTWEHIQGLDLQDIPSSEVQILIGANVPEAHIQLQTKFGSENQPVAVKTALGWSLIGLNDKQEDSEQQSVNFILQTPDSLDKRIEDFWKTESFGVSYNDSRSLSFNDRNAKRVLDENTVYKEGHYEVPMLWADPSCQLPNNFCVAERRYQLLTKRLSKNTDLKSVYCQTLNGYINKGYAMKIPTNYSTKSTRTWYLPHHGVTSPSKPGKVRVVFDAASVYNGTSLNQSLVTGPDLLNSLFGVLQRFRLYEVAIVSDVEAMFHQVLVPECDQNSLRFLWKEDPCQPGPPDVYCMKVHIFGAVDSPTCANYALQRTAIDNKADFSKQAINATVQDFYVDDLLKSVETESEAISLFTELTQLLQKGGFKLHKWMSSHPNVTKLMNPNDESLYRLDLDTEQQNIQRALGLSWNIAEDAFIFNPKLTTTVSTKRNLVSVVSSIFDPLGFITPFTIRAKCLIQDVWKEKIDWDEQLSPDILNRWNLWSQELDQLQTFKLPRHHSNHTSEVYPKEIHIFADASETAFGSVAYLRYPVGVNHFNCSLLASKTRVAPLKPCLSIPRLELQAAVLAVRLWCLLKTEINIPIEKVYFWTDSTTVLQYINNKTKRFKPFVSNRTAEIQEYTNTEQWFYVPTALNPADICSRGCPASSLSVDSNWLNGPDFLYQDNDHWPVKITNLAEIPTDDPEIKTVMTLQVKVSKLASTLCRFNISLYINPSNYSSWIRLQCRTAWLLRAVRNFLAPIKRFNVEAIKTRTLLSIEYQHATVCLVRKAQEDGFPEDIRSFGKTNQLSPKSRLLPLSPIYDGTCLIVGGRLKKAKIPVNAKHQYILPDNNRVTYLILQWSHLITAHGGSEYMVSQIRQQFWPISARRQSLHVINCCYYCKRVKASPVVPKMADLPLCRADIHAGPFHHTGVDYFGPLLVKYRRSTVKKWGCIFTCMTTRAVHLELADSRESDDFIMVLRSFIGRRGTPSHMYSDNGTNFVGAVNDLKEALAALNQTKIANFLAPKGIDWHFNPPSSPHFGGAWERLVKSTKTALSTILRGHLVSETVLRTALIEVEAVLNNRPLTHNSTDPDDLTPLTPNHFLIGKSFNTNPPGEFSDREINSRKRWRQVQVLTNNMYKRFLKEYLPSLTIRQKWRTDQPQLHNNDLVLLVEDQNKIKRRDWPLGRITNIFPGDDGKVRTVEVKTATGVYTRPATKVCLLEENI